MAAVEGKQLIGYAAMAGGDSFFESVDRVSGDKLHYRFYNATEAEVSLAVNTATDAFGQYRLLTGLQRADFLDSIVTELLEIRPTLVQMASTETALPQQRIEGEFTRTINQIKLFAAVLREGRWVNATIETADPDRAPLPKPDLRSIQKPLGPVAVFGASNFPLAFSVAGGDTISALAAGCTVVFKAHPAHPATCELVSKAIIKACLAAGMPNGVFSMLQGDGATVGTMLVKTPGIKAVGFTGSYRAGKAIFDLAASLPLPIPVYAEMGSSNPVFILPEAMRTRGTVIAAGYATSVTAGVGQFCTNPGLLIYEKGNGTDDFRDTVVAEFEKTSGGVMLANNIADAYAGGIHNRINERSLEILAKGNVVDTGNCGQPVLFGAHARDFFEFDNLEEELFGPSGIVVSASSSNELIQFAERLGGHLTATIHGTDEELQDYQSLIAVLEQRVGRLVINGFPTGVEVNSAMVHGGPFPATTDSRSTSVGTAAIYRFTRPVAYQSMPQLLLPAELQNENPLNIWREVNGQLTRDAIK